MFDVQIQQRLDYIKAYIEPLSQEDLAKKQSKQGLEQQHQTGAGSTAGAASGLAMEQQNQAGDESTAGAASGVIPLEKPQQVTHQRRSLARSVTLEYQVC